MDTTWLESLLALIETGSFARAAEAQGLSQPAFSRRIRRLEQGFGADLVYRSTFPVTSTRIGTDVVVFARDSVVGSPNCVMTFAGRQFIPHDAVRISVSHTLAMYYIATWWTTVTGEDPTCPPLPKYAGRIRRVVAWRLRSPSPCVDPAHPIGVDQGGLEWVTVAEDRIAPYARTRVGAPIFDLPGSADEPVPFVTHGPGAFLRRASESGLYGGAVQQSSPACERALTDDGAGEYVGRIDEVRVPSRQHTAHGDR